MKRFSIPRFVAGLAVGVPLGLAVGMMIAAGAAYGEGRHPPASFEAMDADRDGAISGREHHDAARMMFELMDRNGDGKVTAAEMDAAQERITGRKRAKGDMSSAQKIKAIDANGDGVLTAGEHETGSRAMFEKLDANKDGGITRAEWDAGHAALLKKASK